MKNKKKVTCVILFAAAILLVTGVICRIQNVREEKALEESLAAEGGYIKKSVVGDFEYTEYEDHVVLTDYVGSESEVVIPETFDDKPVTEIGCECFMDNMTVSRVMLNDNIEVIGMIAFRNCEELQEVVNGTNVRVIDDGAFIHCNELKTVEIGNKLEHIGSLAFSRCFHLSSLETQENLLVIEELAFDESGLEEFSFPKSVKVQDRVFSETSWIQNQEEEFIIYGDGDLVGYTGTDNSVMIPEGVKTVLGGCFDGTTADEIYVPETVTAMNKLVFLNCSGVRVYIPESVTTLGGEEDYGHVPLNNDEDDIIIITTEGSYAQQYAEEKGIPYEIVAGW